MYNLILSQNCRGWRQKTANERGEDWLLTSRHLGAIDPKFAWAYLDSTEGSHAHVEEDPVQHRHRDELQAAERKRVIIGLDYGIIPVRAPFHIENF